MFLLLAIITNILVNVVFRYFGSWQVNQFAAIVINYWVCVCIGFGIQGSALLNYDFAQYEKTAFIIAIGLMFILGFNVVAATVKFFGIAFSTIMQKISLVLTALFGIIAYGESSGFYKWLGIGLAAISILFLNRKAFHQPENHKFPWYIYLLPLGTLAVNTLIDCTFLILDKRQIYNGEDLRMVTYIFGMAAVLGTFILASQAFISKASLGMREMKAGILLGLVNYGSIYFLLYSLSLGWEGSTFYPILNTSILLGATLVGIFIFKEHFSLYKKIGFILALVSILIIFMV